MSKLSKAAHKKREQVKITELIQTPIRVLSTGRLNKTRTDPKMGERAKKSTKKIKFNTYLRRAFLFRHPLKEGFENSFA